MKKQLINYETLIKVTKAVSMSRDPEEVIRLTVKSIKSALEIKGCTLFLVNPINNELEVVASEGLSSEYLDKGPISTLKSIAASLEEGPVAIHDVLDDPRIQYPEDAESEGVASILSVPIIFRGDVMGALRVYTAEKCEFTLEDVNFVQALAQIVGVLIEMCRLYQGQNQYIDVLTTIGEAREM